MDVFGVREKILSKEASMKKEQNFICLNLKDNVDSLVNCS